MQKFIATKSRLLHFFLRGENIVDHPAKQSEVTSLPKFLLRFSLAGSDQSLSRVLL